MDIRTITTEQEAGIRTWLEGAAASNQRTDSAVSRTPRAVMGARNAIRQHAREVAHTTYNKARMAGHTVTEARRDEFERDLVEAMASGLGIHKDGDALRCDGFRTDASWFPPDALTYREPGLVRSPFAPRVLSASIPVRNVDAWAERFQVGTVAGSGSVAPYRPGMTDIPRVGVSTNYRQRPVHTFVTSTSINWMHALQGARSDINIVAENAEAARDAFGEFFEEALVNGVAGLDYNGIAQLGATRYTSTVDYSSASLTLDDIYRDFATMVQSVRETAGFRGSPPNTLLLGSRWANRIKRTSNYAAGGDSNGSLLIASLAGAEAGLARAMGQAGITEIIEAPSLTGFEGSDYDGALLIDRMDAKGLRHVVAMTPAPVRTHSSLDADETLWAARDGGLDLANGLAVGVAKAQVA